MKSHESYDISQYYSSAHNKLIIKKKKIMEILFRFE